MYQATNWVAAQEPASAPQRLAVEKVVQALDLLVVGRDAAPQQAPRRGQALEEVDLHVAALAPQAGRGERSGGPGADDRDSGGTAGHHAAVRSAVLRSAKNSALTSSA